MTCGEISSITYLETWLQVQMFDNAIPDSKVTFQTFTLKCVCLVDSTSCTLNKGWGWIM